MSPLYCASRYRYLLWSSWLDKWLQTFVYLWRLIIQNLNIEMWKSWEVSGLMFQVVNVYNLWHQLSHNCVYLVTQGKNQELFQISEMKQVTLPLILYCNQKSKSLTWRWHIFAYLYRKSIDHKTTSYDVNYQLPCTGTCIQVRGVVCFDICRIVDHCLNFLFIKK